MKRLQLVFYYVVLLCDEVCQPLKSFSNEYDFLFLLIDFCVNRLQVIRDRHVRFALPDQGVVNKFQLIRDFVVRF